MKPVYLSCYEDQNYALKVSVLVLIVAAAAMFSKIPLDRSIPKVAEQIVKELTEEIVDPNPLQKSSLLSMDAKDTCNSRLAYKLGKSFIEQEKYDAVEELYNSFNENCDEHIELRWLAYAAAREQGDFAQARRLVTAMIEDYPNDRDYYAWRGLLLESKYLRLDAIADFKKVIKLSPRIKRIPLNLAELYERTSQPCKTVDTLNTYFEIYPKSNQGRWERMLKRNQQDCQSTQNASH